MIPESEGKLLEAVDVELEERARRAMAGKVGARGVDAFWAKEFVKSLAKTGPALDHAAISIVISALHQAVADGLLVQSDADPHTLELMERPDRFCFTPRGLRHYTQPRGVNLRRAGDLVVALDMLRRKGGVEPGQIEVLDEARVCIDHGCYRAATVLIGVATEVSLRRLLDVLSTYQHRSPGSAADWKKVDDLDPIRSISGRFDSGLAILRRLEEALQKEANAQKKAASGVPPPWSDLWWRSLDPLVSIAEAVRYARNAAAHEGETPFRRSDAAMLLATMPMTLGHIHELVDFLQNLEERIKPGLPPKV